MATILNHNTVHFEYCELNIASNLSVKLFDIYNQAKKLSESSNHVFSCGLIGRTILKQLRELIVILSYYYFQVKKFMVGYEMLAQCQRDLTAEQVH